MRPYPYIILILCFLMGTESIQANTYSDRKIIVKADALSSIALGEEFKLTYTITVADANDIKLQEEIKGFEVLKGPTKKQSYSSSYISGEKIEGYVVTYTYLLKTKKKGRFKIPAATIKVNNESYTSNTLEIEVIERDPSFGDMVIIAEAEAPEQVNMGEQFRLIYSVNEGAQDIKLQGELTGFTVLMGPSRTTSESWENGISSKTTRYVYVLKATKEGIIEIPAANIIVKEKSYHTNSLKIKVIDKKRSSKMISL